MPPNSRTPRHRKLGKGTPQQVLREDELDSEEYQILLQTESAPETGVEKSEEKEYHLQAALAASSTGGDKDAEKEIPAPPAEESPEIDYEALYPLVFDQPKTYIRFSSTVEECTGCQYDMTTEDDVFLKNYNQKRQNKLSEDQFEKLMDVFEEEVSMQAPFASVDGTVIEFEALQSAIKAEIDLKTQGFAKDVYDYWRLRRQESGNNALQPSLKAEKDPNRDDADPYVCFRRRDSRLIRKTRGRDLQSVDKLKKLRRELEEGRYLLNMAWQREMAKKELLLTDRAIFQVRGEVKRTKVKIGIKTDDEDLINQKPQKRKAPSDVSQMQRPLQPPMRLTARADGRSLDADLELLSDLLARKEMVLQREIDEKAEQHRKWNNNHIDLTREPLSPVSGHGGENGFRQATALYQHSLLTPPSSVNSDSFDHAHNSHDTVNPIVIRYNSPPPEEERPGKQAYRRRIGRGGRLWIDRRGITKPASSVESSSSDRWKYDQDDDDEQPVYEVDPYDIKALKFRATIPLASHLYPSRLRQEGPAIAAARASTANPSSANSSSGRSAIPPAPPQTFSAAQAPT